MKKTLLVACALVTGCLAHVAAQEVSSVRRLDLSFDADGNVSLAAQNVSMRDIFTAWARQCGCYVVNVERLSATPMQIPMQYEHKSQEVVLESLLRQAPGYVLAPRMTPAPGPSLYDMIFILAPSSPTMSSGPSYAPVVNTTPLPTAGSPVDELPPVVPQAPKADAPPPPAAARPPTVANPPLFAVPIVPVTPVPATPTPAGGR